MNSVKQELFSAEDRRMMTIALALARRGVGFTEPNPLVGAVVSRRGRVVGAGYHRRFGHRHAEVEALSQGRLDGTTLYVTLEPCDHQGKTPPCTDLILERRIARVVVAAKDPHPLVNGRGIARLKRAGVEVRVGLLREEAEELNRHYRTLILRGRPYVALHAGLSLEGKMTDRHLASRWMTGPVAREVSHSLRGEFSAVLAGRGTVLADDPRLTVPGPEWQGKRLWRVVLDADNSLPDTLRVFTERRHFPLMLVSARGTEARGRRGDAHLFVDRDPEGRLDLEQILLAMGQSGIASVLVEGGGAVLDSFLRRRLFDEVDFFYAPKLVGGREAIEPFATGVARLDEALRFARTEWIALTDGMLLRGYGPCSPV